MSVWKAAVYRDDTLQRVLGLVGASREVTPYLAGLADFVVEPFGDDPVPAGLKEGNFRAQVLRNPGLLEAIYDGPERRDDRLAYELFRQLPEGFYGLAAVYRLFAVLYERDVAVRPVSKFEQNIRTAGLLLGSHDRKDYMGRMQAIDSDLGRDHNRLHELYLLLLRAYKFGTAKSYQADIREARMADYDQHEAWPEIDQHIAHGLGCSAAYCVKGILILVRGGVSYTLLRNDIDRLARLLKGFGVYDFYMRQYGVMSQLQRQVIMAAKRTVTEEALKAFRSCTHESANWICRAYDVVYHRVLAEYAADITERAMVEQAQKMADEDLNRFVNYGRIRNALAGLPIRDALEVLSLVKSFPQPDFDYFGAATRQRELYKAKNPVTDERLYDLIMRHHKLLMIEAYHGRHGVCPGLVRAVDPMPAWAYHYPMVRPSAIPAEDVDLIDFAGEFTYEDHTLDCMDLVKDKAICPLGIDGVNRQSQLFKLSRDHRNQLLDVISRPDAISMRELRTKYDELFCDLKVDDKPEAKKPHGRWFMEAHTDIRMVHSEYEASIAQYGKELDGYVLGKDAREKQLLMNRVTEPFPESIDVVALYVSYDIKKFSPSLPVRVHEDLDAQWAEAFGIDCLANASRFNKEGVLHYVKRRIHHRVEKGGDDYEGIAGKKLTFYHLAVMRAAVATLRKEGLVLAGTRYAAQIDDGVMRLMVDKKVASEQLDHILLRLDQLWASAGLKISWDKTFVSQHMAVFLNEIRWDGRSVSAGVRAAIKMDNVGEGVSPSLPDDLKVAEATARGALVANCPIVVAYSLYAFLVADALRKWADKDQVFQDRHVVAAFAPLAIGGYGVSTAEDLEGSLNFDAMTSGLSALANMAAMFPATKQDVVRYMNREMEDVPPEYMLTGIPPVRVVGRRLKDNRATVAVKRALSHLLETPVLQAFGLAAGSEIAAEYGIALAADGEIPVEALNLWYQSTTLAVLDTITRKIINSRTALVLCRARTLFRVAIANRLEARQLIASHV